MAAVTALRGMVFVRGGTYLMGSDHHYPEEAPLSRMILGILIPHHLPAIATKMVNTAKPSVAAVKPNKLLVKRQ